MRRASARRVATAAIVAACAAPARAAITVSWLPVSIPVQLLDLAGHQSWDLVVTTDGDWASAGLAATLPNGLTFYKHPRGERTKPSPALVSLFPALAYTTYVTAPADTGTTGAPAVLGGFPEGQPLSMSGNHLAVSWGDLVPDAPGTYPIARLTFPHGVLPSIHPQSTTSQVNPASEVTIGMPFTPSRWAWARDADGEWHVPENWAGNQLPPPGTVPYLNVGGAAVRTITHSQGEHYASYGLESAEHLVISGGLLAAGHAQVHLVTISGAGTFRPSAIYGNATVTFDNGGHIEVWRGSKLVIGPTTTVRGGGGAFGVSPAPGTGTSTLVNLGRVSADRSGSAITMTSDVVANTGTLEATAGGTLHVTAGEFISGGDVRAHAGSAVELASPASLQSGAIGGDGAVRARGGMNVGALIVKPGAGPLRVDGQLLLPAGNAIDLLGGGIVNDYAGASPLGELRAKIITGYANNTWTGNGIRSSTANADDDLAVGYAEAGALFSSFPATFMGESIDDSTLLIRLVRNGDADLDGTVKLSDFNHLAAAFGATANALWDDGDFNYDGAVNLTDFNLLAANFGLSAAGPVVSPADWAALASAVPEPLGAFVSLSAAALAAIGVRPAHRRRRR
jgi:hypothetical protein